MATAQPTTSSCACECGRETRPGRKYIWGHNRCGFPKKEPGDIAVRFWAKVDKSGSCWLWTGCTSAGYGVIRWQRKTFRANRVAFFLTHGRWPEFACHHCDNRMCCNPDHIYDGTPVTNARDCKVRNRHPRWNSGQCANGHEWTEETTRVYVHKGYAIRYCRICERVGKRAHVARRRANQQCVRCGVALPEPRTHCVKCAEQHAGYARRRYVYRH